MKYKIDLHTHTIASGHAYSTIEEYINQANKIGIKVLGISDHGVKMPGGPHEYYFYNLKVLPKSVEGVRILKGIELNILDENGHVDMGKKALRKLDYSIASLHPPCFCFGDKNSNTKAIISAMENPLINIIGHPDDSRYPLDYEKIVRKAKETDTILEINNSSLKDGNAREGSSENYIELLNLVKKHSVHIILASDAHISYDLGKFKEALYLIEKEKVSKELVLNDKIDVLFEMLNCKY